jgi:Dienelactone hydrolase family.
MIFCIGDDFMNKQEKPGYYTSTGHLLDVYDRNSRKYRFDATTVKEFNGWKSKVRTLLKDITGISRMECCELKPQLIESSRLGGYTREKFIIQTEPDVWMPFYVLIPDGIEADEKRPCIIAAHGHGSGGKYSPAGRTDIPEIKETIEKHNYDYGIRFLKEGYIVFCPDARAFGERREWMGQGDYAESLLESTCVQLNHMAICLGQSVTGMWAWDLIRLIDYIETRRDCNAEKLGCCGLSGGGLQSLWLAAMDDRVKCTIVSGYFYGYKDSLLKLSNNCGCNYVPHLWEYVDMGDIGALIAPRALLVETGAKDTLNGERGLVNAVEQVCITSKAYRILNAEKRLYHHIFEGEHIWEGSKSIEFMQNMLL